MKNILLTFAAFLLFRFVRFIFPPRRDKTNRLAIISFHKFGDTVITVPAVTHLLKQYHGQTIYLLTYPDSIPIYREALRGSNIPEMISVNPKKFLFGLLALPSVMRTIRLLHPERIIDISGGIHSATAIMASRARVISGLNLPRYRWLYNKWVPIRSTPHLVDIYLDVCRALNIEVNFTGVLSPPSYRVSDPVTIFPFAGWRAKEWAFENFFSLARQLSQKHSLQFVTQTGQLADAQKKMLCEAGVYSMETKSPEELITVLKDSSVLIAGDTGPVHLAALLGKPTFTIYGPTNPVYHEWSGKEHSFIQYDIECVPTETKYCSANGGKSCSHVNCMRALPVAQVYAAVQQHFERLNIAGEGT